ncbi:MAG: glycosyltransferase N-terminal domain-containing protein [Bacteroidota bacterium]|nr:glycosyltransferase N-terminal domain-containing protein [Bacteroidota bacterium]
MAFVYDLLVLLVELFLKFIGLFNQKISLFIKGREQTFDILRQHISNSDKTIWIHCASLGEYEQGLPIIQSLKNHLPSHKIIVSFFSPSGYELKKNSTDAYVYLYLPLDTQHRVKTFLDLARPEFVIFVKYEFWPNYLKVLKEKNIKTYLVSALFRENQAFFKWYGLPMRKLLHTFEHIFVQNQKSKDLLEKINFTKVTVAGDTRYDRVYEILQRDNTLDFIRDFKGNSFCVVFGSSWDDDEELFLNYINNNLLPMKFIIAPHNINNPEKIYFYKQKISKKIIFFSEKENKNLSDYEVFIIDTIGILTKIYAYADVAYVGGGMRTGLHNILEPAVFGTPIIIGKNFSKSLEAQELILEKGAFSVKNQTEFEQSLDLLYYKNLLHAQISANNQEFVLKRKGATSTIINFILSQKDSLFINEK